MPFNLQKIPLSLFSGGAFCLGVLITYLTMSHEVGYFGALLVLCLLGIELVWSYKQNHPLFYQGLILASIAFILGCLLEFIFTWDNWVVYPEREGKWVLPLYPLISLTFLYLGPFILSRPLWIFITGVILAPFIYLFGEELGAWKVGHHAIPLLAFFFGGSLLCLSYFYLSLQKATCETFNEQSGRLTLLYDGACPVCSKEISFLQKRKGSSNVNFVDIASDDYDPKEHQSITYEEAMKEIIAIDENGIHKGTEAFEKLYAQTNLPLLSILLKLPLLKQLSIAFYNVFSKNRLLITGRKNGKKHRDIR